MSKADFYTAELDLAKGARDDARPLLQSAIDGCPAGAPEATFAKAELGRVTSAGNLLRRDLSERNLPGVEPPH